MRECGFCHAKLRGKQAKLPACPKCGTAGSIAKLGHKSYTSRYKLFDLRHGEHHCYKCGGATYYDVLNGWRCGHCERESRMQK